MLNLLAIGDWGSDQVHSTWTDASSRRIVPEVERLIDQAWAQATARPGVTLFDGPMCRLDAWRASADALELSLSPTSYKVFFGTNLTNATALADRFGRDVLANPVGVSPALETADGFLLLGRRNASVAYYPDRVHPFAGTLEPRDGAPGRAPRGDGFAAVYRELQEELSLDASDVAEVRCAGIVEDLALRQPELIFRAKSRLTRAQTEARLDPGEHHACIAVPATSKGVEAGIGDPAMTPVAVASLLLWGRAAFGGAWFASATAALA